MPETSEARPPAVALRAAAARFGTPVYVIDMAAVADAAARLEAAFAGPWLRLYSLKANDLPDITAFLHRRGWGASVVSAGEWRYARTAGVPNASLAFEGIGKTDAQLGLAVTETAAGRPLRWLAVESRQELAVLAGLAEQAGLGRDGRPPLDVLLRLNPAVSPETKPQLAVGARVSKFGMSEQEILALAGGGTAGWGALHPAGPREPGPGQPGPDQPGLDQPGLRLRGIQVHVGSDLGDVRAFSDAGTRAVRLLATLRATLQATLRTTPAEGGHLLDTVDFGGGFPLPAEGMPDPGDFRDALLNALRQEGLELPPRPAIEPGRYLVGAAGWLVAGVLHARTGDAQPGIHPDRHPGRDPAGQQVVLDAGMTELIRPALYGSRHHVSALSPAALSPAALSSAAPASGDMGGDGRLETRLEGPVCESTDSFGRYLLPPLHRGDLVAIGQAGAYGASFTSRYNGRPAPAEVLLWPDGSLQLSERPAIPHAVQLPPHAPSPARPTRPQAWHTVGSPAVTKDPSA